MEVFLVLVHQLLVAEIAYLVKINHQPHKETGAHFLGINLLLQINQVVECLVIISLHKEDFSVINLRVIRPRKVVECLETLDNNQAAVFSVMLLKQVEQVFSVDHLKLDQEVYSVDKILKVALFSVLVVLLKVAYSVDSQICLVKMDLKI